ncbi:MAG: substrate-binding domain-containing protein, partial [Planctomycetes bacterium]|nr:substrate-binding domain-containing protein [Planctomycetota bacterium]
RAAAAALLAHHAQVDGIVCVNDMIAVGVLEELRARGRQVPRDVQVIGFDDHPLMDIIGLSTIRQPMGEFGAWAAQSIATLLHRPTAGKAPSVAALELPVVLVPRATTRVPRAARTS